MKTSKLRVTGLCAGNSPVTGEFPHKRPVTRKMFPFDDVIMIRQTSHHYTVRYAAPWYHHCWLNTLSPSTARPFGVKKKLKLLTKQGLHDLNWSLDERTAQTWRCYIKNAELATYALALITQLSCWAQNLMVITAIYILKLSENTTEPAEFWLRIVRDICPVSEPLS